MQVILDGSTSTSLTFPGVLTGLPSSLTTGFYAFPQNLDLAKSPTYAEVFFAGTAAADKRFAYAVWGVWRVGNAGSYCYVPSRIAAGDGLLGAATYGLGTALGATGNLWCDTLTEMSLSDRVGLYSPANNEIARLMLDVTGLVGIIVKTNVNVYGGATSMDCMCQLDDRAGFKIVLTRSLDSPTGALASASASSSLTDTDTLSKSASLTKTITDTATDTDTLSKTPSKTKTATDTATDTLTISITGTDTASTTVTKSLTKTVTATDTATDTLTLSKSGTKTATATDTGTLTLTKTQTGTT